MSKPTTTGIGAVLGKRAAKRARKQARKRQRTAGGWRAPVPLTTPDDGPATLEVPTDDERGPGIENGKGEEPGITPSHVSECGCPSGAELTFLIGRMPKEARNG